jgi:hypothetical protein
MSCTWLQLEQTRQASLKFVVIYSYKLLFLITLYNNRRRKKLKDLKEKETEQKKI